MSAAATAWALSQKMADHTEKLLLIELSECAGQGGDDCEAICTLEELADKLRRQQHVVAETIKDLCVRGFIVWDGGATFNLNFEHNEAVVCPHCGAVQ